MLWNKKYIRLISTLKAVQPITTTRFAGPGC